MDIHQASEALYYHSGLPRREPQVRDDEKSLSVILWAMSRGRKSVTDLVPAVHEVIDCLQAINAMHYDEARSAFESRVDRELAYSIAVIFDKMLGAVATAASPDKDRILGLSRMIVHGWQQVLAGDIRDIWADLRQHRLAH